MKTMMGVAILGTLICGTAFAQDAAKPTLRDSLISQGMTEVSDGLFVKETDNENSYVAVGTPAQQAMLSKLVEVRERSANGTLEPTDILDELISKLRQPPQPRLGQQVTEHGDCNGGSPQSTGPFFAQASAGGPLQNGPYGGSGEAVNTDTSATAVNTTNFVHATVYNRLGDIIGDQSSTQHGATPAIASAYAANSPPGCVAQSAATLTCPGHTTPSVSAYASNHQAGTLCVLQ